MLICTPAAKIVAYRSRCRFDGALCHIFLTPTGTVPRAHPLNVLAGTPSHRHSVLCLIPHDSHSRISATSLIPGPTLAREAISPSIRC